MDYGRILRRAWTIAWGQRVLWLFGFLASLYLQSSAGTNFDMLPASLQRWVVEVVISPSLVIILGLVLFFGILAGLIISVLKALGYAALADLVNRFEDGEAINARMGWRAARQFGWRVFWIDLVLGLPVLLVFLIGLAPFLSTLFAGMVALSTGGSLDWASGRALLQTMTCALPFCCLGIGLGWFLGVLTALAERVCVLEDRPLWESMRAGWGLLRAHMAQIAGLWLVLALARLASIALFSIPIILLGAPLLAALAILARAVQDLSPILWLLGYAGVLTFLWLVVMAYNSVLEPFFSASWTLAYREWRGALITDTQNGAS